MGACGNTCFPWHHMTSHRAKSLTQASQEPRKGFKTKPPAGADPPLTSWGSPPCPPPGLPKEAALAGCSLDSPERKVKPGTEWRDSASRLAVRRGAVQTLNEAVKTIAAEAHIMSCSVPLVHQVTREHDKSHHSSQLRCRPSSGPWVPAASPPHQQTEGATHTAL